MSKRNSGAVPDKYLGVVASENPGVVIADRDPTTGDKNHKLGKIWINKTANRSWCVTSVASGAANWEIVGSSALPAEARVSLTSAEVKALATTQIELVAAPGAGKAIQFLGAMLKLSYGGTNAFTESADNLAIKYTDDSGAAVSQTIEMTGFIDQTADTYTNAEPVINAIVAATGAENQALVLDNINDNIAGNAANDNTLEISILYRIVAI